MERAVLQRLQLSLTIPEDVHQFAYKKNRCTLDAVSSLFHFVCKSLYDKAKHVHCAFLDYSSAFDSVPRSLLLKKLQSFGCPSSLLEWLLDYFSRRYQYVKLGKKQSTSSLSNSGVLQGAVLSPYLFTTYISDLPVDLPVRISSMLMILPFLFLFRMKQILSPTPCKSLIYKYKYKE